MDGRRRWVRNRVTWLLVGVSLFLWQASSWLFEAVLAAPTELFFSEYIEGSGSNRALEIFNGTAEAVDLSSYTVELYLNGSPIPSQVALSGVVLSQDVFVVAHSGADGAILAVADLVNDAITSFNGDDSIVLKKGELVVDAIGDVQLDPGNAWGIPPTSTQNHTLRRKVGIEAGDTNEADPFDPGLEWDGFPLDSFEDLGQYELPAPTATPTPLPPLAVVINEVAWGGTAASTADEWIELHNTTGQAIDLNGWVITSTNGLTLPLVGLIEANGFYLIERTDDNTVSDISADLTASFGGGLANGGDSLFLSAAGMVMDTANADGGAWPGGSGSPAYQSMERANALEIDSEGNWQGNDTVIRNGQDADGVPLNGTPRQANSTGVLPSTSTPTLTLTPTPTSTSTPTPTSPAATPLPPLAVVINEVAWSGTAASTADEWLELRNTTSQSMDLTGWVITSTNGLNIPLAGVIEANGFYLVERTDDNTVSDIPADLTISFGAGLLNAGDILFLSTAGIVIDTANGDGGTWPGGSGSPSYLSMERIDPSAPDTETNWQSNDTVTRNGQDADNAPLNGTPRQANSSGVLPPTSTPTPTPMPTPTSILTLTPTPAPTLVLPLAVVINEVAWGGTGASTADEWLELYNTTNQAVDLSGWVITSTGGLTIPLVGTIEANGFYLIERTDDNTVSDVSADLAVSFGAVLANGGDSLFLSVGGLVIDTANGDGGGWPGGGGSPDYLTLERIDPLTSDTDTNWQSNDTVIHNGQDANGAPLNGTPRQTNSTGILLPTSTPTPTLTPTTPTATPTPTSISFPPRAVVINEVAWGGTAASTADEWIELYNTTGQAVDLSGWVITSTNGLNIPLGGIIEANDFYLIERTDDNTISDIPADLTISFGGGLSNAGDHLFLSMAGIMIDTVNAEGGVWPGGSGSPDYLSMERIDPLASDTNTNWQSNDTVTRNGQAADGAPLNGTPRQANSSGLLPPTLTPTPTSTFPTPTLTPAPVSPLAVVINEVAWGGTAASTSDEWIELYNTTGQAVDLSGWVITSTNGLNIPLAGIIETNGFYLIERTDDNTISDVSADLAVSFGTVLANGGDSLFLSVGGLMIDTANGNGGGWPGGGGSPDYLTLERIDPLAPDTDGNWQSNDTVIRNGQDANGAPLNGTPKQANSTGVLPPTSTPTSTPTATPTLPAGTGTPTSTPTPTLFPSLAVVINEVAWGGTAASTADEWLELHNTTGQAIDLSGWVITSTNGLNISLVGVIEANSFYLIERTDDSTVSDIDADLVASFGGGLANGGGSLVLSVAGIVVDTANVDGGGWPGGSSAPTYRSMERVNPLGADSDGNWQGNDTVIRNGQDANGALLNGTPRQANSNGVLPPTPTPTPTLTATPILVSPLAVVINEVAWSGTAASTADEWLELRNTTNQAIDLSGWVITSTSGLNIPLVGIIEANSFYLIERTDDNTVSDISADLAVSFGGVLANGGDRLFLSAGGWVIDTANGDGGPWPAGSSAPDYLSMERIDPFAPDSDSNWQSNGITIRNGQDAGGAPLNGTPGQANSDGTLPPTPTPTLTPTLTPTATTPTPSPTPVAPLTVVINEVAWGGTTASSTDEWLELHNTSSQTIDLSGWVITSSNGLNISVSGIIEANGFYLIERSDDNTVSDINADLVTSFGGALTNGGDTLFLSVAGTVIDTANSAGGAWPGGSGAPGYLSMERIEPLAADTELNWRSNDTVTRNGQDANGLPLNGTPRQANSRGDVPPTPTPTPTQPPPPPLAVVINEVAWSGTGASSADEWLELLNTTTATLHLDGWLITSTNGLKIPLDGTTIEGGAYYLIERTDDLVVSDIGADLVSSFGSGCRGRC